MITSLPKAELDPEFAKQQEDSLNYVAYKLAPGDTLRTEKHVVVLDSVTLSPNHPKYKPEPGDKAFGLVFTVFETGESKVYSATPMIFFRPDKGGFTNTDHIGVLETKFRLNESSLEAIVNREESLQYQVFDLKEGDEFDYMGNHITFIRVNKEISNPSYKYQDGDIAVAANLEIKAANGKMYNASPVYLIRDNQPFSLKEEVPEAGLHLRFEKIDPAKGLLSIAVAQNPSESIKIPFEMAEDASRSDYVVLEAIVFPGINFVWLGAILMMLGLGLSWIVKRRS